VLAIYWLVSIQPQELYCSIMFTSNLNGKSWSILELYYHQWLESHLKVNGSLIRRPSKSVIQEIQDVVILSEVIFELLNSLCLYWDTFVLFLILWCSHWSNVLAFWFQDVRDGKFVFRHKNLDLSCEILKCAGNRFRPVMGMEDKSQHSAVVSC
jgi:hypothetical protein